MNVLNTNEEFIFGQHLQNLNTKWEDFSREIKDMQTKDTFSILYAADIHYIRMYAKYVPAYYKVKEMVEFSKFAGFDLMAIAGDIVDGNTTLKRQKRDLYDIITLVRESKTTSVAISKGNHDDNSWYTFKNDLGLESVLSCDEWYSHVINPIRVQYPIVLDSENMTGGYYYIDYPLHKIRVINLNTSDVPYVIDDEGKLIEEYCSQWNMGMSESQLIWLTEALRFDEPGWAVIFISHTHPTEKDRLGKTVSNGTLAWEIINAYKNGEKGVVKSDNKYYEANVEFDFSENKSNEVLLYLHGHIHEDRVVVKDGITAVSTKRLLGNFNAEWDKPEQNVDGGWNCILIDRKNRHMQGIRYGKNKLKFNIDF